MCESCWIEAGSPKLDSDSIREIARLAGIVYEYSMVGGNLHIYLDDDNVSDESIRVCAQAAEENQHGLAPEANDAEKKIIELALPMTEDERMSALAVYYGYGA